MLRSLVLVLLLASTAIAQKAMFSGPPQMKVGERSKVTLKGEVGDDPKAFPKNDDILLARDFNDPSIIILWVTPSKPGELYLGIASNSGGKTLLYEFQTVVIPNGPQPQPQPQPQPKPENQFRERLTAVYMVNPDKPNKDALVTHLTNLNAVKYNTKELALAALKNHQIQGVKPVRDEIAKILSEQVFTPDNFQATITLVVAALKELP